VDQAWCINDKVLQIIGVGEKVEIKFRNIPAICCAMSITGQSKVLIKNLTLEFPMPSTGTVDGIDVVDSSTMWMEGCEIRGGLNGVSAADKGHIDFKGCSFKGAESAIAVDSDCAEGKLMNIIGCSFGNHGTCIDSKIPVRCVGNTFVCNWGAIICSDRDEQRQKQLMGQSTFKGNVIEKLIVDTCKYI